MVKTQLVALVMRPGQAVPDTPSAALYVTSTISMAGEYTPAAGVPYCRVSENYSSEYAAAL